MALAASAADLHPDEVRPGQRGTARTVFQGSTPEEFAVEVLGVARQALGPGRDLIVIRLLGETVERTGVVAGMSGSPVMVEGELLGALAYRLGAFPTEPIAGVTPFAYMEPMGARPSPGAAPQASPLDGLPVLLRPAAGGPAPAMLAPPSRPLPNPGSGLEPIATPLLVAGGVPAARAAAEERLQSAGWVSVPGGSGRRSGGSSGGTLQAGDAVAAVLLDGDLTLAATGTVTAVREGRVFAFGHPVLPSGAAQLPMARVEVVTTVASQLNSYKIANLGEVVGTFREDRSTGLLGELGSGPPLVPLEVSVGRESDARRRLLYGMVSHPSWSPFLAQTAVLNSLLSEMGPSEPALLEVRTEVRLEDGRGCTLREAYSLEGAGGLPPAFQAASDAGRLVAAIAANRFEDARIAGVQVNASIHPGRHELVVEDLQLFPARVRAGEDVEVRVAVSGFRLPPEIRTFRLRVPPDAAPGPVQVLAGGAGALDRLDAAVNAMQMAQIRSLAGVLRWVDAVRSSDRLYVRLYRESIGAISAGRLLPDLPPSVRSIVEDAEAVMPLGSVTLEEVSRVEEGLVLGGRRATLEVLPRLTGPGARR